jgi:hypothetical protein
MTDNNNFYYDILLEYIKNQEINDLVESNLPFSIQNDYNIILDLVKHDGYLIHCASDRLRGNKEIVLTAIRNYSYDEESALGYASNELRGDKEVVFAAVQEYGAALEDASEELRNDKEVVLTAVKKDSEAFQFASTKLKGDDKFILAVVENVSDVLQYVSKELKEDKIFLIKCYRLNKTTIYYNDFIKRFNELEEGQFNNTFIKENIDISHLLENKVLAAIHPHKKYKENIGILDLLKNKKELCDYLINNKDFDSLFWNKDNKNDIIYSIICLAKIKLNI